MKRSAIIFLRTAIFFLGIGTFALYTLLLPTLWKDIGIEYPAYAYAIYAVFIAMFMTAIPFYIGLYSGWRLLAHIEKGMAFTRQAAAAVRSIAIAAGIISFIYVVSLPFFYVWADNDDAPGIVVIGMVLVGGPMVVSVFAFLLHLLISEASDLKSENELTV